MASGWRPETSVTRSSRQITTRRPSQVFFQLLFLLLINMRNSAPVHLPGGAPHNLLPEHIAYLKGLRHPHTQQSVANVENITYPTLRATDDVNKQVNGSLMTEHHFNASELAVPIYQNNHSRRKNPKKRKHSTSNNRSDVYRKNSEMHFVRINPNELGTIQNDTSFLNDSLKLPPATEFLLTLRNTSNLQGLQDTAPQSKLAPTDYQINRPTPQHTRVANHHFRHLHSSQRHKYSESTTPSDQTRHSYTQNSTFLFPGIENSAKPYWKEGRNVENTEIPFSHIKKLFEKENEFDKDRRNSSNQYFQDININRPGTAAISNAHPPTGKLTNTIVNYSSTGELTNTIVNYSPKGESTNTIVNYSPKGESTNAVVNYSPTGESKNARVNENNLLVAEVPANTDYSHLLTLGAESGAVDSDEANQRHETLLNEERERVIIRRPTATFQKWAHKCVISLTNIVCPGRGMTNC